MQKLPKFDDPNLIVGAEHFADAGVYRLADDLLIAQSLDFFPPLVDDPFLYGQIAAANSLSDLYAMGAKPVTALNIVGFPDDKLDLSILADILRGGADRVLAAGAVVAGGHTVRDVEIKYGLSVTGTVHPDRLLTNTGAQPGDVLLLTKPLGTGFVTTAFKEKCPDATLDAATGSMKRLNRHASEAAVQAGAHGVTDITGFGLAGHAYELASASGVTIHIAVPKIPLLPGAYDLARQGFRTRANATNRSFIEPYCRFDWEEDPVRIDFCFDPQTSGGLLISLPGERVDALRQTMTDHGEPAPVRIGYVKALDDKPLVLGGELS